MPAPGDKEFTLDNDIQLLFREPLPADVRKSLMKLNITELLSLERFLGKQLSREYQRGKTEGALFGTDPTKSLSSEPDHDPNRQGHKE